MQQQKKILKMNWLKKKNFNINILYNNFINFKLIFENRTNLIFLLF